MNLYRLLAALPLAGVLALSVAAPAGAASVSSAGFTDRGTTLVAVGTVGGLDPALSAQVNLTMAGTATVACVGTGATRTVSVSQGGPADALAPGETVFAVETYEPVVTPENARCPASVDSVQVLDVEFSRAVLTVIQGDAVEQSGYAYADGGWSRA